ncbi:hypothetical protein [Acinetobacter bereziniae]|uniref:hypothetical protein n=1 Tax=Acinetobacter bereziniae TaxID=106648 RepID=UPI00295488CD|nr:hypothetical protein [Acinetobacter bereziniae]MDV8154563.1 hypothetical protein [Acinetobacter bereziniae]
MSQVIEYLPFESYRKYLRPVLDGRMGLMTHVAELEWHDGVVRDSYVKFYDHEKKRGLLNEAIGFLLISTQDLPQPEFGGFLEFEISPDIDQELWSNVSEVDRYRGKTIAWVTSDTGGINRKLEYSNTDDIQIKKYIEEQLIISLKNWKQLQNLIMCDDWLLNADRNLGNLLELPNRTFTLIDHGNILCGNDWSPWQLMQNNVLNGDLHRWYCSILKDSIDQPLFDMQAVTEKLLDAKLKHLPGFITIRKELLDLIEMFLGDEFIDLGLPQKGKTKVAEILYDYLDMSAARTVDIDEKCELWLSPSPISS